MTAYFFRTRLLFAVLLVVAGLVSKAQSLSKYANKAFYLLDSFDLRVLDPSDLKLADSCLALYHKAKSDTARMKQLSVLVQKVNAPEVWLGFAKQLEKEVNRSLSKKAAPMLEKKLTSYASDAYRNIGFYYFQEKPDYNLAEKMFLKAIDFSKRSNDSGNLALIMTDLASLYSNRGNIKESMNLYLAALNIQEKEHDSLRMAQTYGNIGNLLRNQADYIGAEKNLVKSVDLFRKLGKENSEADNLNLLGIVLKNTNRYDSALKIYNRAQALYEAKNNDFGLATILLNKGIVLQEKGDYDKALHNYNLSLGSFRKTNNKNAISYALNSISIVYMKKGDFKAARQPAEESMDLAKEIGFPENIMNAANALREIYKREGNYNKALEMHELYTIMNDSILSADVKRDAIEKDLKYQHDKELMAVEQEREKDAIASKKDKEKKNILLISVSCGMLLLVVFFGLLYNRFRFIRSQKNIIEFQKQQTERQKKLVEEKQTEILDSINYAKRIQQAILPPPGFIKGSLPDTFICYIPKDIVAGDFYWMEQIGSCTYIAAADSTGHGVPGALVSVVCSNALNRAVKEFGLVSTGNILDKTRELVLETFSRSGDEIKDGMDISLLKVEHVPGKKIVKIEWSGANNALWYFNNGIFKELKPDKQPIGQGYNMQPFATRAIEDHAGMFYLFTDGFADQFGGPKSKKYKPKQLQDLLEKVHSLPLAEQKQALEDSFMAWKGNLEQIDDVTIIGIKL